MGCQEMAVIVCASWGRSVSLSGKPNARPGRGPSLTYGIEHTAYAQSEVITKDSTVNI